MQSLACNRLASKQTRDKRIKPSNFTSILPLPSNLSFSYHRSSQSIRTLPAVSRPTSTLKVITITSNLAPSCSDQPAKRYKYSRDRSILISSVVHSPLATASVSANPLSTHYRSRNPRHLHYLTPHRIPRWSLHHISILITVVLLDL
jgi:hypothetical protein